MPGDRVRTGRRRGGQGGGRGAAGAEERLTRFGQRQTSRRETRAAQPLHLVQTNS